MLSCNSDPVLGFGLLGLAIFLTQMGVLMALGEILKELRER